ncbi:MAG TPA: metal ABC transporter permease [Candidatus Hydrogenedentes bacterium]|nr:metal ABC transporter permease [Candidatus Hydrogenedentota bacterium]
MDWGAFQHQYLQHAFLASLCAGVACATVGVFVVTMHLSFLGVCIAHAAFAGALMGVWLGFEPLLGAVGFSLGAAVAVGPLADRGELSPDASTGIIFSFMLGLAFLFLGLTPDARTEALNLFWGSILTVRSLDLAVLVATVLVVVGLVTLFYKEVQAVLCHRSVALAVGIHATLVFYGMLVLTGLTIAVSLRSIGGLLIYSLILNPAAAAFQLTYSLKRMFVLAALFGVAACWAGLAASYFWDLPAGACIVLSSSLIFAVAAAASPKRKVTRWNATSGTR